MKYFYLALSLMFLFASCSKSSTSSTTNENILRAGGRWRLGGGTVAIRLPNGKDTILQYMNFVPSCFQDDYLEFDSVGYGYRFTNATKCSPADPDSVQFSWAFTNNNANLRLYNGFNDLFAPVETILPVSFDTTQVNPYVIVDSITYPDGLGNYFTYPDSIYKLYFGSTPVGQSNAGISSGSYDLNATIVNLTTSSFTLNFSVISTYQDSTNYSEGYSPRNASVTRPDTFRYSLNFHN